MENILLSEKSLSKGKVIAIHQPNYLPWAGYFYKMAHSDIFVFLDDVQYTKGSFINRNRIKTSQGVQWLTIPVHSNLEGTIRETPWTDINWPQKHLKTVKFAYGRAPYFNQIFSWFFDLLLSVKAENVADLNIQILKSIAQQLNLSCSFNLSSNFNVGGEGDDRLIQLVLRLDGDTYLSGYGGFKYQNIDKFKAAEIHVQYYNFTPPEYPQLWGDFESGLSIIDILFNCGFSDTSHLIKSSGKVKSEEEHDLNIK